jgi:hypothetical protein
VVNAATRYVTEDVTMTVTAHRLVYDLWDEAPNLLRLHTVIHQGRDLERVEDWNQLWSLDPFWFRRVETQLEAYALVGKNLLILAPAPAEDTSVTLVYEKSFPVLTAETDTIELPDELSPLLLALCEAIAQFRDRRLDAANAVMERFAMQLPGFQRYA